MDICDVVLDISQVCDNDKIATNYELCDSQKGTKRELR